MLFIRIYREGKREREKERERESELVSERERNFDESVISADRGVDDITGLKREYASFYLIYVMRDCEMSIAQTSVALNAR